MDEPRARSFVKICRKVPVPSDSISVLQRVVLFLRHTVEASKYQG